MKRTKSTNRAVSTLDDAEVLMPEAWGRAYLIQSPEAILLVNEENRIVYANPAACALLRGTLDTLNGLSIECLAPHTREGSTMSLGASEGEVLVRPVTIRCLDGRELHVTLTCHWLALNDGRVRTAWVTLREAAVEHDRNTAETARRLMKLFRSVPTCIMLLSRNGQIEELNRLPPFMDEISLHNLRGRPATDLPLLASKAMRSALRQLLSGKDIHKESVRVKNRLGIEIECSIRGIPLIDEHGQEGAVLLIDEITGKMAADERDRLLASITQCSNDAIISIDAEGAIQIWNQAAEHLFGYTYDEMLGQSWMRIVPQQRQAEWNRILRLSETESGARQVETIALPRNGEEEPVEVTISALRDERGGRVGSALLIRSVAERKRMEQRLRQAERLASIGQLAAGIAHEINNPLTSIKNSFYIVRSALPPAGRSAEFAQIIDSEIDRISGIVNCLLDCHRPRVHEWTLVDIAATVRACVSLMEADITAKGIRIHLFMENNLPTLLSSEHGIKQVMINLLMNAAQSMPQGGDLTVQVRADDAMVRVAVADTGCGIAEEHLAHIFDPFFTTKHKGPGTSGMGLGLSVSLGIAETLGGFIEVESKRGEGSCFTMALPIEVTSGHRESHEPQSSLDH